jgi:hypothetical protein
LLLLSILVTARLLSAQEKIPLADEPQASETKNIFAFGADIGTPAGFNFRAGLFTRYLSLVAGGGYWSASNYGAEATATLNFWTSGNLYQGLGVTGGFSSNNPLLTGVSGFVEAAGSGDAQRFVYLGPQYLLYISGFTLAAGLSFGAGDYKNPQFIFHFGYMFRLGGW